MTIDRATRRARRMRVLALAQAAGVKPSMGGIARAAGLATSTVTGAIDGRRATEATVSRLAIALGVPSSTLGAIIGAEGERCA